ncbi:MAG TPA: aspartate/glutamate racemase family protein [Anaerolineae bacterium]|nr:aspartate/glutamate racemase family protein [Anaerolineae bacterium]HIP72225.1 aspartate/glutamate racemase family protein [Anaerolineae bacterium]
MNEKQMIGVVGGVGPFAGVDLLRKIAEQTEAARDQDHLPILSISHPGPIGDRTEYLLGREPVNPAYALAAQLRLLSRMGAAVAGIPCNTAHAPRIFDVIRAETADLPVRLLHMIEEVGRFLQTHYPEVERVGILSTVGTYQAEVYPQVLEKVGFTAVTPPFDQLESHIHPAIYDPGYGIKAQTPVTERARADLLVGVAALQEAGAQAVILGCTEIPLAIPESRIGDTIMIDPTLILARALIREAGGRVKGLVG